MLVFTNPEDYRDYFIATTGHEPSQSDYWNEGYRYAKEKLKNTKTLSPLACATLKSEDMCSLWNSSKTNACSICQN